jgi:hypothetical protein
MKIEDFWTVDRAGERLLWHLNRVVNPKIISEIK